MPKTEIIKIDPVNPQPDKIKYCAQVLRKGGLVIFPTETVYGIAANLLNKKALHRLYEIKNRPKDRLFSIHIADKDKVEDFASEIPVLAYKFMDKFWPGPLTIILRAKDNSTVGLRMPKNNIALNLISRAAVPIVAPSANLSGNPPPKTFAEAIKDFDGLVDMAIDGGNTQIGIESTVLDLTQTPFKMLREGAIKKDEIDKIAKTKTVLFVCTGNSCRSVMAKYLLEKALKANSRQDIEILSAGSGTVTGMGASQNTVNLLGKEGIEVSSHKAQALTNAMIKKSDLILVMERMHEALMTERLPSAKNRVFLLKEFAKIEVLDLNIPDPIGKTEEFYQDVFNTIKEAITRIVELI